MQIGNDQLSEVYDNAIEPAIRACGLEPKRIDKHNEGGLLTSEIFRSIKESDIVVADLTNERPNCYLEVGYTVGIGKTRRLVLTVRENHSPDNSDYQPGGPKVHFDIAAYDMCFWNPRNLEQFRDELERRIRRAQARRIEPVVSQPSPWDDIWFAQHERMARDHLQGSGKSGFMEARFTLSDTKLHTVTQLRDAAREARRAAKFDRMSGPAEVPVLIGGDGGPKPKNEGIVARDTDSWGCFYWALRENGDFYMLRPLDDSRWPRWEGRITIPEQVYRITRILLFGYGLYKHLEVAGATTVNIIMRHAGLTDRTLYDGKDRGRKCVEDEVPSDIQVSHEEIDSRLVGLVAELSRKVFALFDFFDELDDNWYERTVGKVRAA